MKNKDKSFAQKARDLINLYKGASYDTVQKKELEEALAKLAQEQEEYKAANGIGVQDNQEYSQDGTPQFGGKGSSIVGSFQPYYQDPMAIKVSPRLSAPSMYGNIPVGPQYNTETGLPISSAIPKVNPYTSIPQNYNLDYTKPIGDGAKPYSTSIIPSLAAGAASTIGNLYLAKKAGKYVPMASTSIAPEQISLANERQRIEQEAAIAGATGKRSARTAARTRGEYMGNVGNVQTGLNKNVSEALGKSYQTEALTNAQARQQAAMANAQMKMSVDQYNTNLANQALANKQQYQSAAIESVPQMISNINQLQNFDKILGISGGDYTPVLAPTGNTGLFKRKYAPKVVYRGTKTK